MANPNNNDQNNTDVTSDINNANKNLKDLGHILDLLSRLLVKMRKEWNTTETQVLGGIDDLTDAHEDYYDDLLNLNSTYLSARQRQEFENITEEQARLNQRLELNKNHYDHLKELEEKYRNEKKDSNEKKKTINLLQEEFNMYKKISQESSESAKKRLDLEQEILKARLEAITFDETVNKKGKKLATKKADKAEKEKIKLDRKDEKKKEAQNIRQQAKQYSFWADLTSKFDDFRQEFHQGVGTTLKKNIVETMKKTTAALGKAISQGLDEVNSAIKSYASMQTTINSRLQGTSSFSEAVENLSSVAYSPLLSTEDLYSNLQSLVNEGIVTNVEQRAFLQTIKSGIADTFDVNESYLKRLIKVQQSDSTASRLGMEGYLTRFLNAFVENTEYLTTTFDNVADKLLEASSLMTAQDSTEFEYVVQKWLGTLTGVGVSEETASSIADALGKLGSGDVDFFSEGIGNLITISAGNAGKDIGQLINDGLTATDTNDILKAVTEYLQEIGSSTSNVVKNQLAKTFGVSVSDLVAVTNLAESDLATAYNDMLSYTEMYAELSDQMSQLSERVGISNILSNLFSNYTYQTGMDIASSPAMYATWAITDLIGSATGGIDIPYVTALGTGVDLEATVDNLIKTGIIGASTIGAIGDIINGLNSVKDGSTLLDAIGVSMGNADIVKRGDISKLVGGKRQSGTNTSTSTYMGNTDSSSYTNAALNSAYDEANKELDIKLDEAVQNDAVCKYLKEIELENKLDTIIKQQLIPATSVTALASQDTSVIATTSMLNESSEILKETESSIISQQYNTLASTDIGSYLAEIEFASGFRNMVENIQTITNKISSGQANMRVAYQDYSAETAGNPSESEFTGFTL